jgi:hypothetical protein
MSTPEQAPPNTGRPFLRRGPSGPLADIVAGLIQCGYDQPIKTQTLQAVVGPFLTVPRDADLNPLQVQLPNVTPGNILEVDFSGNLVNGGDGSSNIAFIAVVSFDGSTVFPTNFFGINNSQIGDFVDAGGVAKFRSLTAVVIPDGATTATVQIIYNDAGFGGFGISGTDAGLATGFPGFTLKASEISAASVPQPGPSNLISP